MRLSLIILFVIIAFGASLILLHPIYFGTEQKDYDELQNKFFLSNPTKVYTEQLKFREKAIQEYKKNLSGFLGDSLLDSSFNNPIRKKIGIKYLLPQSKTTFLIPLNSYSIDPYELVGYDSLSIEYTINDSAMNAIIMNQDIQLNDFTNVLKYQDYLKISKKAYYHIKGVGVIFSIGILIFLYFLINFLLSIDDKKLEKNLISSSVVVATIARILKEIVQIDKAKESSISDNEFKDLNIDELKAKYSKSLDQYKEILASYEKKLTDIQYSNTEYYIIENIAQKAEEKMREVGRRSNLMLVSGLIMAFIGIIVFYITLPVNLVNTTEVLKIISMTIRPALILLFIESTSWYLLKQHKYLLNDYKYYHSIFNKKINYLASYKLISQNKNTKDNMENILPLVLLSEEIKAIPDSKDDDTIVETSEGLLKSLFDKLISKI